MVDADAIRQLQAAEIAEIQSRLDTLAAAKSRSSQAARAYAEALAQRRGPEYQGEVVPDDVSREYAAASTAYEMARDEIVENAVGDLPALLASLQQMREERDAAKQASEIHAQHNAALLGSNAGLVNVNLDADAMLKKLSAECQQIREVLTQIAEWGEADGSPFALSAAKTAKAALKGSSR